MKKLCVLLLLCLFSFSCRRTARHNENFQRVQKAKPVLGKIIIGDWKFSKVFPGVDTVINSAFPGISLDSDFTFYASGRFKKHNAYYSWNGKQEKVAGYSSDYKIKGDTLFVFEPDIKHWYSLQVKIFTKDSIGISNGKGYSYTDSKYFFSRVLE